MIQLYLRILEAHFGRCIAHICKIYSNMQNFYTPYIAQKWKPLFKNTTDEATYRVSIVHPF